MQVDKLPNRNRSAASEFPSLLEEEDIDRAVPSSDVVRGQATKPPSEEELTAQAVATLKSLYPRIHDRLGATWGSKQCEDYLDRLILDDRGDREGFQPAVLTALLVLQRVHAKQFGSFKRRDPWDVGFQK